MHRAPHTTSRAFYRGAVRDESHAIYQGLIQVDHEAAGTDAYLTNKNLILSDEARADSIPSLNIKTDDVRCSHGSTTGKLDENQLFYLRTRGYTEAEAKRMLVEGYFEDLILQTPELVHEELRELIMERIPKDE
jgi:Fe-S cluster assembly protein SufD